MSMIQCPKCGQQVPEDSKFCSNCGAPIYAEQKPIQECIVNIRRKSKVTGEKTLVRVYVNGEETNSLENGKKIQLILPPGQYDIAFGAAQTISTTVHINLQAGQPEANILCEMLSAIKVQAFQSTFGDFSQLGQGTAPKKPKTPEDLLKLILMIPAAIIVMILAYFLITAILFGVQLEFRFVPM